MCLSASQVDKTESICYDTSLYQQHAALEDIKIIRQISLVKVYESLNFPIALLTLLPQASDKDGDMGTRIKTFFSLLTQFLILDKEKYFQKFIRCKGHQMITVIIRNENLADAGLDLLNSILNLRRVRVIFNLVVFYSRISEIDR